MLHIAFTYETSTSNKTDMETPVCLFIYDIFNDTVSSSGYTVSNDGMTNK
jgi:hypothetical protein